MSRSSPGRYSRGQPPALPNGTGSRAELSTDSARTEIVPVEQLRLSDAVAAQLQELIQSGHFRDGRLPSERELANQFGVGRGTMREAIRRLEALGILAKNQGVGTFVVEASDVLPTAIELLSAGDVSAHELFEVRYALEPFAAALAAQQRVQGDVRKLESTLTQSTRNGITPEEFVLLDFKFHSQIAAASKNRLLARLYQHVEPHHYNYSLNVISIPGRMERATEGHLRIVQAIANSDERAAKKEALAHLRSAEKDLISALAETTGA